MKALITGLLFSAFIGTIAVVAISGPLHAVLSDICDTERRSRFWLNFSNLMLYLTPMLSVLAFGLSDTSYGVNVLDPAFVRGILSSALAGTFAALIGIAFQLARAPTRRPAPLPLRAGERALFDDGSKA